MSHQETIRAWRDEEYRTSLSEAQRALLPDHPAGLIELSNDDLDLVAGGRTCACLTFGCCEEPF